MNKHALTSKPPLVVILGHTAGGKTGFAARLAKMTRGEIISADSRQVYRGMDIGTGKDYADYIIEGEKINFHLIDIADPGYEYNVFEFQRDFIKAFKDILSRNKLPFLCGGTGLYISAVLKQYELIRVPVNMKLREELSERSTGELVKMLVSLRKLHNTTDTVNRKRLIRSIEIEKYRTDCTLMEPDFPDFSAVILGIRYEREERRRRITERLEARLKSGMIEEADSLLKKGISPEILEFYGLEYKYLAYYLTGKISYLEMFTSLNTAIHQFAKRQMTWFRKMEREGIRINWIEGEKPMEKKLEEGMELIRKVGGGMTSQ